MLEGDFPGGLSFQPADPPASSLTLLLNSTVSTLCESTYAIRWEDHASSGWTGFLAFSNMPLEEYSLSAAKEAPSPQLFCSGSLQTSLQVRSGTLDQNIKQANQQKANPGNTQVGLSKVTVSKL